MFRRLIAADELVSVPLRRLLGADGHAQDKEALEELVSDGGSVWQVWERLAAASVG